MSAAKAPRTHGVLPAGHRHARNEAAHRHLGGRSGTLRAAVFGVNDGLVSNLALILGVAGSGASSEIVIVAGLAGLLAGASSMGAGEYLSMRVQRDVFEHLLDVEAEEIKADPKGEQAELADIYERKGVPRHTAEEVSAELMKDPRRALDVHAREELGLDPEQLGSPWGAALSSFFTFAVGAIVPLLPYLLSSGTAAFAGSIASGGLALGVVGGTMARLTERSILRGAIRMLSIGTLAAGATYLIGTLFNVATS